MVSEMSLPTIIMICVGWRKKNKRFNGEISYLVGRPVMNML